VLAWHQSGEDGSYSGHQHRADDAAQRHNLHLWETNDINMCTHVDCAHYKTTWVAADDDGRRHKPALMRLLHPARSCFAGSGGGRSIPSCPRRPEEQIDRRGTTEALASGDLHVYRCADQLYRPPRLREARADWGERLPVAEEVLEHSFMCFAARTCLRLAAGRPDDEHAVFGAPGEWRDRAAALWPRLGCPKLCDVSPSSPRLCG
jgi:hypothetical protein